MVSFFKYKMVTRTFLSDNCMKLVTFMNMFHEKGRRKCDVLHTATMLFMHCILSIKYAFNSIFDVMNEYRILKLSHCLFTS